MHVTENSTFTADYYARDKRFIGNAIRVFFADGSATERVAIDYPVGHRLRRDEGIPLLRQKFEASVSAHFDGAQAARILALAEAGASLEELAVDEFVEAMVVAEGVPLAAGSR
jgi:2-methylcitrate dehydratase